jgi:SAM-dependent methyltransferase
MSGEEIEEQRERLLGGWDGASKGWGRQADRTHAAARPISEWMVDHAAPGPGDRVLELAAGPGDTGFMAWRRIAPGGTLICSDASQGMLAVAKERAAEQRVTNVEFKQLQLEWIDLPAATIDVILCRWGLMLTIDPAAAMRECRRVLKPGGRLAAAVWDTPDANPWATVLQRVIVELGHAEPPAPGPPGMFALSRDGLVAEMLAEAGFFDIVVEPVAIVRQYSGVLDWIGETRDLSQQFASVWGSLSDPERQELRERVAEAAAPYTGGEGSITLSGSSLAVAASA